MPVLPPVYKKAGSRYPAMFTYHFWGFAFLGGSFLVLILNIRENILVLRTTQLIMLKYTSSSENKINSTISIFDLVSVQLCLDQNNHVKTTINYEICNTHTIADYTQMGWVGKFEYIKILDWCAILDPDSHNHQTRQFKSCDIFENSMNGPAEETRQ